MTTIFGYRAKLTIEINGREHDITHAIDLTDDGMKIDPHKVLAEISNEPERRQFLR